MSAPPAPATTSRWCTTASSTACSRPTPRATRSCTQSKDFELDLHQIAVLWNHGSVVRSWLNELAERAFAEGADLAGIRGYVEDSGEGRWTVQEAIDLSVPAPVITLSLLMRFGSRQDESYSAKVIAALRQRVRWSRGEAVMTAAVVVPATVRGEAPAPAQPLKRGDACTVVIFGASGDLAKRKLFPALFHLQCDGMLHEDFALVGVARAPMSDEAFRRARVRVGARRGRPQPGG